MHLVLATEAAAAQRDRLTYSAWGAPLSMEGFATREQRLRAHAWSRAAMKTWLLCAEDGSVLASCESFHTDSFIRAPGGTLVPGDSFAIASVFTEERLRGRGYASRMMELLTPELERLSPRAQSALLFSDVGASLYQRSGYREAPAWDWHLASEPGDPTQGVERLLSEEDVEAALARMHRPEVPFFYWPSAAQLDWHLERERIYAELLARPRPESCGAQVGDSTVLWSMVARSNTLAVLMLDVRTVEDMEALLRAAQRAAYRAQLGRVVVWEEPATAPLLARMRGTVRVSRDGSLPMLRPLRPDLPLSAPVPFPRALWV